MSRGTIVFHGTREELAAVPDVVGEHLGVGKVKSLATLQHGGA